MSCYFLSSFIIPINLICMVAHYVGYQSPIIQILHGIESDDIEVG